MPIISKAKTIDLGTLDWIKQNKGYYVLHTSIHGIKAGSSQKLGNVFVDGFINVVTQNWSSEPGNKLISLSGSAFNIYYNGISSAEELKQALSGVMLTYEIVDTVEENIIRKSKNLLNEIWQTGYLSAGTGEITPSNVSIVFPEYIKVKPNTIYYLLCKNMGPDVDWARERFYNSDKSYIGYDGQRANNGVIITPGDCEYIRICTYDYLYGSTYNHDIALIESTYGEYEPYGADIEEVIL